MHMHAGSAFSPHLRSTNWRRTSVHNRYYAYDYDNLEHQASSAGATGMRDILPPIKRTGWLLYVKVK
jgi:hypothetical protein